MVRPEMVRGTGSSIDHPRRGLRVIRRTQGQYHSRNHGIKRGCDCSPNRYERSERACSDHFFFPLLAPPLAPLLATPPPLPLPRAPPQVFLGGASVIFCGASMSPFWTLTLYICSSVDPNDGSATSLTTGQDYGDSHPSLTALGRVEIKIEPLGGDESVSPPPLLPPTSISLTSTV